MKKFLAFTLPLVIGTIAIFQITLMTNKNLFEAVCSYTYPTDYNSSQTTYIDRKYLGMCLIGQTFKKISQPQNYCQTIPKPVCDIQANDKLLCDKMIQQGKWTGSLENCLLDWACPELNADYQDLIKLCQN